MVKSPVLGNFSFHNYFTIIEYFKEKICRFVFGKFVKTFRELDNSEESFSNL